MKVIFSIVNGILVSSVVIIIIINIIIISIYHTSEYFPHVLIG